MASPLFGKWKLERSEQFDEYMKAVGAYGSTSSVSLKKTVEISV